MNQHQRQQRTEFIDSLPVSPESNCPYLAGCTSAMRYFFSGNDMPPPFIDAVLEYGFRRCGDMWYLNECPGCRACIPYRVPTQTFTPSKNMKRVLRRNADVTVTFATPEMTPEKTALYLNYQHDQHFLRPAISKTDQEEFEPTDALETMAYQMYENPDSTLEVTMTVGDQVVGFGTLDVGETSVSLVYFAFDTTVAHRSLGTLNILKSIEWAKANGYPMAYLGLYIENHQKMHYKSRFGPAEIMAPDGTWVPFGSDLKLET